MNKSARFTLIENKVPKDLCFSNTVSPSVSTTEGYLLMLRKMAPQNSTIPIEYNEYQSELGHSVT